MIIGYQALLENPLRPTLADKVRNAVWAAYAWMNR
jgi:hypothetical protein